MKIVLTPAQLQLVAGMRHGSVALFPDPFHGWFSQEINRSLAQAMRMLVEEQLAVQEANHIRIHDKLSQLIDNVIRFHHLVFLQITSNRDSTQYFGFYRMKDEQIGTFISRIGINTYALQEKNLSVAIGEYVQIMSMPNTSSHTSLNPFQLSQQNIMRLLDRNVAATQPVRAYDFTVVCNGNSEFHRLMFIRNQWWNCSPHGDNYLFHPVDAQGFVNMVEQFFIVDQQTNV